MSQRLLLPDEARHDEFSGDAACPPQLLKGGQGRRAGDIEQHADAIVWAGYSLFMLIVGAVGGWIARGALL